MADEEQQQQQDRHRNPYEHEHEHEHEHEEVEEEEEYGRPRQADSRSSETEPRRQAWRPWAWRPRYAASILAAAGLVALFSLLIVLDILGLYTPLEDEVFAAIPLSSLDSPIPSLQSQVSSPQLQPPAPFTINHHQHSFPQFRSVCSVHALAKASHIWTRQTAGSA